jgi:hypothetical protein
MLVGWVWIDKERAVLIGACFGLCLASFMPFDSLRDCVRLMHLYVQPHTPIGKLNKHSKHNKHVIMPNTANRTSQTNQLLISLPSTWATPTLAILTR